MIQVFVASSRRFADVEWMTAGSIFRFSNSPVSVQVIRPETLGVPETGCTGFTNLRYLVPDWIRSHGYEYAIYLDVDMLVLADIAELWAYRQAGKWVTMADGSDEVSIFHRDVAITRWHDHKATFIRHPQRVPAIPAAWNVEDRIHPGMKLLHFTDLRTQPWDVTHPDPQVDAVYREFSGDYA